GWQKLPLIIQLSALMGALVGVALIAFRRHDRNVPIPFGPYLAAAGWVALVWGDRIVDWYLDFAGRSEFSGSASPAASLAANPWSPSASPSEACRCSIPT